MKLHFQFLLLATGILFLMTGCEKETKSSTNADSLSKAPNVSQEKSQPPPAVTEKTFTVFAKVTEVNEKDTTITIEHEKMDGFMDAMEMAYRADPSIQKEVRVGTKGHFTLKVVDGEGVIISVHVHKH